MLNETFSVIFKHSVHIHSFTLEKGIKITLNSSHFTLWTHCRFAQHRFFFFSSFFSLPLLARLFGALASAVRMLFYCLQLRCSGLCYCCCTKVFLLLLRDPFSDGSNAASKSCAAPSLLWTVAKMKIWGNRSHFSTVHCSAVKQELEIAKNPSNPEGLLKERSFVPSITAVAASFCIVALILHKVHEKLMLNFEFGSLGFTQMRNPH